MNTSTLTHHTFLPWVIPRYQDRSQESSGLATSSTLQFPDVPACSEPPPASLPRP